MAARVAIVGCGAIAQSHARALPSSVSALYDLDRARAEQLRAICPQAVIAKSLDEIEADAAIVAVPNAFHAATTIALLERGLHVLCEKPLALSRADAERMVSTAEAQNRLLACGMNRRFNNSTDLVEESLRRGLIGEVRRVIAHESVFNWPLARATFDRAIAGGGVLIDLAPHLLDLLALWLGPLSLVEHRDDAQGGVEALSHTRVRAGAVECELTLTRAWGNANWLRIEGSSGFITVRPHERDRITLGLGAPPFVTTAERAPRDPFRAQLENFVAAVEGREPLRVPARSVLPSVALIDEAYRARQPLADDTLRVPVTAVEEPRKILVTGASGGVGSRLVEIWAHDGKLSQLRCLVRSYKSAARLMRFPIEIVEGDLHDGADMRRAADGCDAIVHLGVGERAAAETKPLVEAALALGVRRFVHMSSAAVYGRQLPASLEDDTPLRRTGESYPDEKAAAERIVGAHARALGAIILRPHIVYGPGMTWTGQLLELLQRNKICVVEDAGFCNLIYVDDLVESVRAALAARGPIDPIFITDGNPIAWSDYIDAHARAIGREVPRVGRSAVESGPRGVGEWLRASARPIMPLLRSREFRAFVFESPAVQATVFRAYLAARESRKLRPLLDRFRNGAPAAAPAQEFDRRWREIQLSQARLSPARAVEKLDFRARVDFAEGLARGLRWFARFDAPSKLE